jgi:hypothetical protein
VISSISTIPFLISMPINPNVPTIATGGIPIGSFYEGIHKNNIYLKCLDEKGEPIGMPPVAVSRERLTSLRLRPRARADGWSYSMVSTGT